MRRTLVLAAATVMLGGLATAPATAAPPQRCNATLTDDGGVYTEPRPRDSRAWLGFAEGEQRVRIVEEASWGLFQYRVEAVGRDIRLVRQEPVTVDGGWVSWNSLEQTKQLERCLDKRF